MSLPTCVSHADLVFSVSTTGSVAGSSLQRYRNYETLLKNQQISVVKLASGIESEPPLI